ncbi:LacI family DNA-binding transcriptional regulator [Pseudonocardia sp. TRM90224]|uniref:LacI family DNA-binding transcriptional regulator n=1 Tax=Pseudonocardia sp. TRM90224 TaxID=2812678 RepID=UPI001E380369|nr:LacI family DNA-binding transcriptional regulator [Pseudonocardia sp. TRM90224]
MAATIRDVASAAGVSASTVSRAFTAPDLVGEETRGRVRDAAQRLGYLPNRQASGLITGRTGNIGLVVPDLANPFYTEILKPLQSRARGADYELVLTDSEEDPELEPVLVRRLAGQVDGLILCSPRMSDEQLADLPAGLPIVTMYREVPGRPCVLVDYADGMEQVVRHLVALGHRRIAYVAGPRGSRAGALRREGLQAAIGRSDAELVEIGHHPPHFDGGGAAADPVLASGATAVIAFNDLVALGLLAMFTQRGVRVPAELSVVGCDDVAITAMAGVPLTTVSVPFARAVRNAVDLLLATIAGNDAAPRPTRLPTHLVARGSTGPAPR